jgi:hypothetical protein
MGEVKPALNVHLSSTDRGNSTVQDVIARNRGEPAAEPQRLPGPGWAAALAGKPDAPGAKTDGDARAGA